MNILVTDFLYPSRFSSWRNNTLDYFLLNGADALIFPIESFAGRRFERDWDFANRDGLLDNRHITFFDHDEFMRFNKAVSSATVHTRFQQNMSGYAITSSGEFDLRSYDAVFHIFLSNYYTFNNRFEFPESRQIIHLYPGGGFDYRQPGLKRPLPSTAGIIATHPLTSHIFANRRQLTLDAWTGPFWGPNSLASAGTSRNKHASIRDRPIVVATASLGKPEEKGISRFNRLAAAMSGNLEIEFRYIGNALEVSQPSVKTIEAVNFLSLESIYRTDVDVYVNLESGLKPNGWPLGMEAAKQACALLSVDWDGVATQYGDPIDGPTVVQTDNDIMELLSQYARNREQLLGDALKAQAFAERWGSLAVQQDRYLDFIEGQIQGTRNRQRGWLSPLRIMRKKAVVRTTKSRREIVQETDNRRRIF